jgi:hypothetical protein
MSFISLARTHSILGEKNEAFDLLETAYKERIGLLISLGVYPTLARHLVCPSRVSLSGFAPRSMRTQENLHLFFFTAI